MDYKEIANKTFERLQRIINGEGYACPNCNHVVFPEQIPASGDWKCPGCRSAWDQDERADFEKSSGTNIMDHDGDLCVSWDCNGNRRNREFYGAIIDCETETPDVRLKIYTREEYAVIFSGRLHPVAVVEVPSRLCGQLEWYAEDYRNGSDWYD